MRAEQAIFWQLSNTAALTALVGTNIEPSVASQSDEYPCCLLTTDSDEEGATHQGSDGTSTAVVSIDCEATTYTTATQVAIQARKALNFGQGTWGAVIVQGCFVEDETDAYEYIDAQNVYYGITIKAEIVYQV